MKNWLKAEDFDRAFVPPPMAIMWGSNAWHEAEADRLGFPWIVVDEYATPVRQPFAVPGLVGTQAGRDPRLLDVHVQTICWTPYGGPIDKPEPCERGISERITRSGNGALHLLLVKLAEALSKPEEDGFEPGERW